MVQLQDVLRQQGPFTKSCLSICSQGFVLLLLQDVLQRVGDSVIGSYKADFFDKTTDNADL